MTVFLVALASGRRRSEIHALSISDECFRFVPNLAQVSLLTEPSFLSKTQKPGKAPAKIVIKSLAHHVGKDLPDYTLCPVRARLFLPFKDTTDDISTTHISRWIVDFVKKAHRDTNEDATALANVKAHEVRAIATSWATYNNAPFEDIMQAADWLGKSTFASFYSRAMVTHAEGLYGVGPVVAAQSVIQHPPSSGT